MNLLMMRLFVVTSIIRQLTVVTASSKYQNSMFQHLKCRLFKLEVHEKEGGVLFATVCSLCLVQTYSYLVRGYSLFISCSDA